MDTQTATAGATVYSLIRRKGQPDLNRATDPIASING